MKFHREGLQTFGPTALFIRPGDLAARMMSLCIIRHNLHKER